MRFERIATTAGPVPAARGPSLVAPAPGRPTGGPARPQRPGRIGSDRVARVRLQVLDLLAPCVLGVATVVARLATAATGPTDWDSAQYVAAVSKFDVNHGRPQPPGYWLYVVAGRLVHGTGLGTVESLVVVSALASGLAAGLVVVAGRDLGGRWVGLAAGLVVATSPFAWFSGSIVATYSFDLAVAPLLIVLAWRARPGSWHGAGALAALGLAAGFRQSVVLMFALLAAVAVAGSVRRVRHAVVAAGAGVVAVTVWFVPMVLAQPGGASLWFRTGRAESQGALGATSVLDHAAGGTLNLGIFSATTAAALLPLAALALVCGAGVGARALVRRVAGTGGTATGAPDPAPTTPSVATAARRRRRADWSRPWFQSRTVILVAATVPPMTVVALVEFAKGGYLLAYLPGAVIALLLVPGALVRPDSRAGPGPVRDRKTTGAAVWTVVASVAVAAVAVFGADRFLASPGVLPIRVQAGQHGLWLTQARYGAPYPETSSAIRSVDTMDTDLGRLGPLVDPRRDVVVIDALDGGAAYYRNAGWALPGHRVALIGPGVAAYNEFGGTLYYTSSSTIPVGPGGSIYLIASPLLPGLRQLAGAGKVTLVRSAGRLGDFLVWRITPGASVLGVQVAVVPGPRPLGHGLVG